MDAAGVRRRIRSLPLRPYDNLESAPFATGDLLTARIRGLTADGFEKLGFRVSLVQPDFTTGTRSFHFLLHAWDPLASLLNGLLPASNPEGLATCLTYALAWIDAYEGEAEAMGVAPLVEAARSGANEAWEGMATGMRAFRLAGLVDAAARSDAIDDAVFARLLSALRFHFRVLREPTYFMSWSNHGLYQTLGLLSAATRFDWLDAADGLDQIARERLEALLASHFDAEGVHLEHSPTYHANLIGSLIGARNAGLLEGTAAAETIAGAERALAWMVTPAGRIVPFGDSWPADVRTDLAGAGRFRDPGLRYLTSEGAIGDPPPPGVVLYRNAGYAFARIYDADFGEDPRQASYLAQGGAFHSRVHKHADHLTFSWSEGGCDILVQPGRFGYLGRTAPGSPLHDKGHWYDDPRRMFVESTRAHNCISVDGENHPRRQARPFGGGISQADDFRGLVLFQSAAPLEDRVQQQRLLILKPRAFLLIIDGVAGEGPEHAFRQWFQLDGNWEAKDQANGYGAVNGPRALQVVDLTGRSVVEPIRRGQKEPELQGWISPRDGELAPASSLCLRQEGPAADFVTLFTLAGGPVTEADPGAWTAQGRTIGWSQDGRRLRLVLSGTPPRRLRAALEIEAL